jgi:hypothetical protein
VKRYFGSLFPVVCLALSTLTVTAKADTLTLVSASAQSGGEYIQPYEFSLNGSPTTIDLMCMDLNREITFGETWNVTEISSTSSFQYEEEAFIYSQVGGGVYSDSDVQWAAWSIFDPTDVQNRGQNTANVQALLAAANLAVTNGLPDSFYSRYVIYIPTGDDADTDWTAGTPQRFIGDPSPVPETSTLLMLGTGLVGAAGMLRRRISRS